MDRKTDTDFGMLGKEATDRLNNDNDIKIIVQGKNSQTGIGKTTFAIELARYIDQNGWDAKEKAFVDVQEYLNSFLETEPQSALLLDEIGAGADSRRATSKDNVELSQGWQMLRARNIATIATLPSTNMLDSRMLELADYWVLVKKRGLAQPYKVKVNDFNGKIARKPLPGDEHIRFYDLPNWDGDKNHLDRIKDNKIKSDGPNTIRVEEHKGKLRSAREKAEKNTRNTIIRSLYNSTDMSYAQIGEIEGIELTKQAVGNIVREEN